MELTLLFFFCSLISMMMRLLLDVSICFCPTPEPLLVVQSTSLLPYLLLHCPSISSVVLLGFVYYYYYYYYYYESRDYSDTITQHVAGALYSQYRNVTQTRRVRRQFKNVHTVLGVQRPEVNQSSSGKEPSSAPCEKTQVTSQL